MTKKLAVVLAVCLAVLASGCAKKGEVTTTSKEALTYYNEGMTNFNKLFFTEAAQQFEKAIQADSTFAMAYCRLSMVRATLNDEAGAKEAIQKAQAHTAKVTDKERAIIAIQDAEVTHNYTKASELLADFVKKYPKDKEGHLSLGYDHYSKREFDQAIAEFKKALDIDSTYVPALNALGYAYSSKGQFDDAIATLKKYAALAPDEPNPHDSLGDVLRYAGRYDEALAEYQKALELKPDFPLALAHIADVYREKGMYNAAIQQQEKAFVLMPATKTNEATKHATLGYLYWKKGDLAKALAECQQAVTLDPESIGGHFGLGLVLASQKKTAEARAEADRLISIIKQKNLTQFNEDRTYHDLMGRILLAEGKYEDAISQCQEALEKCFPEEKPYYHHALAEGHFKKGMLDAAIVDCKAALQVNPSYAPAYYLMAQAYEKQGQTDLAAQNYVKFANLWKDADKTLPEVRLAQAKLRTVPTRTVARK